VTSPNPLGLDGAAVSSASPRLWLESSSPDTILADKSTCLASPRRESRRGRAHIWRCASSAPRQALRPRLGYPTRLTPRRTVQALYRQSSLSGSRYRARWRHESRIFVIVDKFSGIRSHCTLPPLYPPITDGPNIGVMSGRQCVAGSVAAALRQASRSSRSTSAAAPSMGVRPSRVGLRGRGGCCDQRRGAVPVNKAGRLL